MAARTHSADPRAERVRTRLRDAAFALAHEHPVDTITVADLVRRAEVSRQVFYQHFADRDDAVAAAFAARFAAAAADIDALEPRRRVERLFAYAADHRAMYRNVVPSTVFRRVVAAFRAELMPACDDLARRAALRGIDAPAPDAVSRFLAGGFLEVLRSYMEDPDPGDLPTRVATALDTVEALLPTQAEDTEPAEPRTGHRPHG